jgi:hypothetical protein
MGWSLNDAQTWTVIGVLAATLVSSMAFTATLFTRTLKSEIGALRAEMRSSIGGLRGEMETGLGGLRGEMETGLGGLRGEMQAGFARVDARFEAVDARFEAMNHRIDGLDRDIHLVFTRVFGTDRDQP